MRNIIFISKDALNIHALPVYGNNFWKTPNIDKIAKNGTVFNRHLWHSTAQAFYYPYWNEAQTVLAEMREIKGDMWRNGTWFEENYNKLLHRVKMLYDRVRALRPDEHIENIGK